MDECDHVSARMIRDDSNGNACVDTSLFECKMNSCICHHARCEEFDISASDNDDHWTNLPWLHDSCTDHIRMVSAEPQGLESGRHCSG